MVRRQDKQGESLGQSFYWGFLRKDKTGQGKQVRLTSLNNSRGLWAMKIVSSYCYLAWGCSGRGILPPELCKTDRGCMALGWLVCLLKACSL